ncbi:MAG: segregation/condensation protein A [Candidatus Anstonellales archaeon]
MLYPLYKLVEKDTWKEILLQMVETHKLDPWNINIVEVSELFLKEIAKSRSLQYCANVILAAAILLKMKSDILKQREEQVVEEVPEEIGPMPEIAISSRFPPKRQVTLEELIEEVEKVMSATERQRAPASAPMEVVEIEMDIYDVEKEKEEVLKVLEGGAMEFFEIAYALGIKERAAQVILFLSLLHLFQSGEITIEQKELFGSIMVDKCRKNS